MQIRAGLVPYWNSVSWLGMSPWFLMPCMSYSPLRVNTTGVKGEKGVKGEWRTVERVGEVDVGVAERASGGDVPAETDGDDLTAGKELLVERRLRDALRQIADVETRRL